MTSHTKRDPHYPQVGLLWNGTPRETIKMVAGHPLVPLNPNINVGENERLSFHTASEGWGE
jgi:hypothetical protein